MSVLGFDVDRCLLKPVWAQCGASLSLDKDFYWRLSLNLSLVDEVVFIQSIRRDSSNVSLSHRVEC